MKISQIVDGLASWRPGFPQIGIGRYLAICSVALAGELTVFLIQWMLMGTWLTSSGHRVVEQSAQFLPVPLAFMMWLAAAEQEGKPFTIAFSPIAYAWSMTGFASIPLLFDSGMESFGIAFGVISGLFIFVPVRECLRRMIEHPRLTLVLLFGASAAINYYQLLLTLWETICVWTTLLVSYILNFTGTPVETLTRNDNRQLVINSAYFIVEVNKACSGLEGIFLFNFMLSCMLMLDWKLFRSKPLLALYAFGVVYMFIINAIRISLLFTLGYWAHHPDAWDWVTSLRGAPLYLFHAYEGWVFYLIAFTVFAYWMYGFRPLEERAS